jgi:hypothetical protein
MKKSFIRANICHTIVNSQINYGTVGDKVIEAMNESGLTYKVFKTQLGYSRV